jgi:long-chain acyl-CoA synthetase
VDLFERAAQFPDQLAVDDLVRTRTWSELVDRSTRLAHVMRDEWHLEPGDHVASIFDNRVEWFELSLATLLAGVWLVPINAHLQRSEVDYVLGDAGARVVLCDAAHADLARSVATGRVVGVGAELDALIERAAGAPFARDGRPGGRMHYTSGTTGQPKGVKRDLPATVDDYLALLGRLGRNVGLDGRGPHLLTGPHYHAAVGGYALFDLVNGAPVTMMAMFDAAQTLELIDSRRIAHTHLVPTMMVRLLRLDPERRVAFRGDSLTYVMHGAAPISRPTKTAMIDWWGPIFSEYWGTSEAGTFTLISSEEWLAHPGSVGRALPGVEIVAVDDANQVVPTGSIGTLYCRMGPNPRPFRYHHDPDKTDRAYLEPGLFTMGDMGRIEADGYVYLADRATNMIISGGVNIYPAEVEAAVAEHPAVADVAVFGVPDEEWGEQVKAAVELVEGHVASDDLAREIIAFARDRLAHYKAPKSIDFAETLPRLPSGKLATRELKDPYWQGRDRRI